MSTTTLVDCGIYNYYINGLMLKRRASFVNYLLVVFSLFIAPYPIIIYYYRTICNESEFIMQHRRGGTYIILYIIMHVHDCIDVRIRIKITSCQRRDGLQFTDNVTHINGHSGLSATS